MNILRKLSLAAVAVFGLAGTASAQSFDWDGFYAGVRGTVWFEDAGYHLIGVGGGFNIVDGNILYGVDGHIGNYFDGDGLSGLLQGRFGVLLTDDLLLYGAAGGGFCCGGAAYFAFGGGVELALGSNLSLTKKVNVLAVDGWSTVEAVFGLNYHFN